MAKFTSTCVLAAWALLAPSTATAHTVSWPCSELREYRTITTCELAIAVDMRELVAGGNSDRSLRGAVRLQNGVSVPASQLMGKVVYLRDGKAIGEVVGVKMNAEGVIDAIAISVGRFLALGSKNVVFKTDKFALEAASDGEKHLVLGATRHDIETAPEWKAIARRFPASPTLTAGRAEPPNDA